MHSKPWFWRLLLLWWLLLFWFQKPFSGRAPPCRQGSADIHIYKSLCDRRQGRGYHRGFSPLDPFEIYRGSWCRPNVLVLVLFLYFFVVLHLVRFVVFVFGSLSFIVLVSSLGHDERTFCPFRLPLLRGRVSSWQIWRLQKSLMQKHVMTCREAYRTISLCWFFTECTAYMWYHLWYGEALLNGQETGGKFLGRAYNSVAMKINLSSAKFLSSQQKSRRVACQRIFHLAPYGQGLSCQTWAHWAVLSLNNWRTGRVVVLKMVSCPCFDEWMSVRRSSVVAWSRSNLSQLFHWAPWLQAKLRSSPEAPAETERGLHFFLSHFASRVLSNAVVIQELLEKQCCHHRTRAACCAEVAEILFLVNSRLLLFPAEDETHWMILLSCHLIPRAKSLRSIFLSPCASKGPQRVLMISTAEDAELRADTTPRGDPQVLSHQAPLVLRCFFGRVEAEKHTPGCVGVL